MTHTEGPWIYDADGNVVVSATEREEWSVGIDGEEPVARRVISTFGAMGGNDTDADLALIVAAPELLDACERLVAAAEGIPSLSGVAAEAAEVARRARDAGSMARIGRSTG